MVVSFMAPVLVEWMFLRANDANVTLPPFVVRAAPRRILASSVGVTALAGALEARYEEAPSEVFTWAQLWADIQLRNSTLDAHLIHRLLARWARRPDLCVSHQVV